MLKHRYLKNVTTLALAPSACTGCGLCMQVCPHAVFQMKAASEPEDVTPRRVVEIVDPDACMECGACVLNCPTNALTVKPGVGCAAAILYGLLHGTEPDCGSGCCTEEGKEGSCC